MSFPSDNTNSICNVDGEFSDSDQFLEPSKELAEYFIQFRTKDVIDAITTFYFPIDINENEIIKDIMIESINTKNEFRNILRDGVALATLMINYDRTEKAVWARKEK